ncbi:MAG TPA: hypothetical protein DHV62_03840, partial [Elusimicrobia bacterium]|nr:hypothetical protein [Elusimicrobiota bacterium]
MEILLKRFLLYLRTEKNFSPHSLKSYQTDLTQFFSFLRKRKTDLTNVDRSFIRLYLSELNQREKRNSVIRKISSLRSFFKYLVREKTFNSNPLLYLSVPKKEKLLPHYLEEKEMSALLDSIVTTDFYSLRNRAILETLYSTGMRIAELVSLNCEDIDFFNGLAKVMGKGSRERIIPIGEKALGILRHYLKNREEILRKNNFLTDSTENACLPARQGERRTERMLDRERYQTVYAKEEGAVAAPTAGLHFTKELLEKLSARGVKIVYLVLHIGPATFQPVKSADIREHNLEKEYFFLPTDTTKEINSAKKKKKKIIACGTSVVRVLELQVKNGILNPGEGYTDAYIYPGYQFQLVDTLITNFHLPKSTNLILVSAFAGREKILQLYEEAKKEKYRFYSYGDAM